MQTTSTGIAKVDVGSTKSASLTIQQIAVLLALCIPLYFIGLGVPPLIDPDEPVYAATGLAALRNGTFAGWWSPHYNGALWFDKPPMTYWLIGLSESLFGATPLAARLPSAFCAVVVVLLTAFAAARMWTGTKSAGFWAGVALATSFQSVILARAAVTDMILAALLTGAFMCMWSWLENPFRTKHLLLAGLLTGFATLTKGPVAIVLVGGSVLFYFLATRQISRLLSPYLWLSLLISVAVSLPWYLSMIHLHGSLFITGFLEANNLTRYLQPEHPQTSSVLWFGPVLLGFIFPWTVPLIFAIVGAAKAARAQDRACLYSIIWICWVFVFFSASQTKLLTYIYPLYPVAAMLIGRWIGESPSRNQRLYCGVVFCTVGLLIAIVLPGYVARGNGLLAAGAILRQLCLVFVLSATAVAVSLLPRFESNAIARRMVFAVQAMCIAVFFALVALAPIWHQGVPDLSLTQIARYIRETTPADQVTIAYTLKRPSLVFYSERNIVFTDDTQEAARRLTASSQLLCVLKTKYLMQLTAALPSHHYKLMLHSGDNYVLIKYQP